MKLLETNIVPFPTTQMLRNLLVAQVCLLHYFVFSLCDTPLSLCFFLQVTFKDHKFCLMTSHLESCKGHAEERMKQLRVVMQNMADAPDDATVLFGGDTNLRDTEVRT